MGAKFQKIWIIKLACHDEPFIAIDRDLAMKEVCAFILLDLKSRIHHYVSAPPVFIEISNLIKNGNYEKAILKYDMDAEFLPADLSIIPSDFHFLDNTVVTNSAPSLVSTNSAVVINNHQCTACGNTACNKQEKSCWRCGNPIS